MGQGLGQRPGDDGRRSDFTPLRLDEMLAAVRARRDERRGHGRPPGALPGRSRRAALVDRDAAARVRAGAARAPHAPGRDQRARRHARRRAARRRVLRRRGRLDPLHPARLHARQAGRHRGAREPGPRSSCSPSTASSCGATAPRRRTGARSRSSTGRSSSSTRARPAPSASAGPAGGGLDDARRGELLPRCCRRCAARCRASAPRCSWSTRRRARSSSSPRARRPSSSTVGAACPDHLVHTKRVPLWIPFDPAAEDAGHAGRAHPRARRGVPRRLPRVRRPPRRRLDRRRPTPTRASC